MTMKRDPQDKASPRDAGVFIDVTDLLTWQGRRTGIQRMTHDLVAGYLSFRDVRLLHFAGKAIGYVEISVEFYLAARTEPDAAGERRSPVARWVRSPRQVNLVPKLRSGDSVLLTGSGWTQLDVLRELGRLRRRHGVKVHRFIHDVMPITEPQFFHPDEIAQFSRYTDQALSIADSVMTSSTWNANQLSALFDNGVLPTCPVAVVGLGDDSLVGVDPIRPPLNVSAGAFVLVVGSLDVRKNQRVIYQAYQLTLSRGFTPPTLVLVGPHGRMWQESVHLIGRDVRLGDRVIVATSVSDQELAWLYRNCTYTVYPSLCEGWGLPIGESLAFGKVCLSSASSAMPEVGGPFAHYFDPHDPTELLDLIVRFADADRLRAEETRLKHAFTPRTWANVARAMQAVVEGQTAGTLTVRS